ncbi:sulfite reductase subunit alpha [Synoicihabitans lomoniglobus]|uniref:assimilatory sulfite reductase (NADPH) n=1 Tax=Synoicihabitans lomoniglobus TaxID=2909285 RepID=A0AAF0CRJ0_9BACT|nr:sulfite reductase subunit alpha [Opitutaceae bacterium LMO-M01]WED66755.1 sulfite reductase subunit alpha [Opitutaceae bacterium LMO-M01]
MSTSVPFVPDSAPFSPDQRAWLNGFFAGMFSRAPAGAPAPVAAPLHPLTILWGSQTGTAESLAKQAAKAASQRGFAPTIVDMAAASPAELATAENVLVITSTYGDGEPPDNAKDLWDALRAADAAALPAALRFSICALGDTNYELFCQCGKDFDEAFAKLGATRVLDRVDCDVDYDDAFAKWLDDSLNALGAGGVAATPTAPSTEAPPETLAYGKKNPFPAPILAVHNLNAEGSAKEVNHVEFSLEGSGLNYEAGDALAVVPTNDPELVGSVLALLGCDGEEAVATPVGELPLRSALTANFDLGKPAPKLLATLKVEPAATLLDVLDVLEAAPKPLPALTEIIANLKKLQPRLYSISSSPKAHENQVHLTVGAVRYEVGGRARKGVCSTFLGERGLTAGTAGVFVHANKAFRPPADPSLPMIMVGPGTGIAPFRAFLEEREATAAPGKNWLFFGDQHAATDYLYEDQIGAWQKSGLLNRVDTAFSRDQEKKVYVQDRMREAGAELWSWLSVGGHFYVCGDAKRMAKDVDTALHDIVIEHGGKTADEAADFIKALKADKRYARDVY